MEEEPGTCYGPGSVAGAVFGTFLTTCVLIAVVAVLYRRWRRNKGKHLVLVTDPEIVDEAYAFDNPCFKDTTPAVGRSLERPTSVHDAIHHATKDHSRWTTPWSNLGKHEKRQTLDDSCLDPKAARVSVVGLRSRDFTGLGFNVCGNMREGIFVKDLLHRGPASESGRIHPGDRITSVKISFRSMVYEDALTILSYASPYDVELEVESGCGIGAKPATLLKKSVGPTPTHICHPLYRSQSIPELSQQSQHQQSAGRNRSNTAKRLFDPNDSSYSNYSTMNSTIKSTKSTPAGGQTHEQEEVKSNHHTKFGIKVLPALDGTVHRVENQNEHNTNLERRHSKKLEEKRHSGNGAYLNGTEDKFVDNRVNENLQQKSSIAPSGKRIIHVTDGHGIDVPDRAAEIIKDDSDKPATLVIPSEVPAEVHNAAMAARRNRKSSSQELLVPSATEVEEKVEEPVESTMVETKSPQKGKRKAPAPPSRSNSVEANGDDKHMLDDKIIDDISDYKESDQLTSDATSEKVTLKEVKLFSTKESFYKVAKSRIQNPGHLTDPKKQTTDEGKSSNLKPQEEPRPRSTGRRTSESDTDSEIQHSFTTIELNPADITIHHTPVPEATAKDDDDEDDNYRKAASLGDLSKYETKPSPSSGTLERAQSLDMTDAGSKKRKAPQPPPEDIHESTEDLTKLDQLDAARSKLKKSSEWGTLEDAIWSPAADEPRARKKSSGDGTLERSKSNVEIKVTAEDGTEEGEEERPRLNVSDGAIETSLELYNLPLSKKLTQDFIRAERLFDPVEDNALARLVNDGEVLKSPTAEEVDLKFRREHPLPDLDAEDDLQVTPKSPEVADTFEKAIRYFDEHTALDSTPVLVGTETKVSLPEAPEILYAGKKEVVEEPMSKVTLNFGCPGCDHHGGRHTDTCSRKKEPDELTYHRTINVNDSSEKRLQLPNERPARQRTASGTFETHFAKPILNVEEALTGKSEPDDEEDYEFGSAVTVNNKVLPAANSPSPVAHNVSNVSVSSGESSEDSGLARGSLESYPKSSPQKMTFVTEIKVSPSNRDDRRRDDQEEEEEEEAGANSDGNEEIVAILEGGKFPRSHQEAVTTASTSLGPVTSNGRLPAGKKPPVPPRRSDATRFVPARGGVVPTESEKQVVYVSEYKSPAKEEAAGKKLDSWVFVKSPDGAKERQQEINPWANGSSPSAQPVTNIVLAPAAEEKLARK